MFFFQEKAFLLLLGSLPLFLFLFLFSLFFFLFLVAMSELPNAESSLHLMPVAAFLGCFAIFSIFSLITSLYSSSARVDTIKSKPFAVQSLVTVVIAFCYGLVVGSIEASTAGIFDPLDILEISAGANVTVVKRAYKKMSLLHHPDKAGGSKAAFQKIAKAYEALTDPLSMENLEKYGHPDGECSFFCWLLGFPLFSHQLAQNFHPSSLLCISLFCFCFSLSLSVVTVSISFLSFSLIFCPSLSPLSSFSSPSLLLLFVPLPTF